MLPLSLLNAAQANPILVELKNGETYNGHLMNCDSWMNILLKEVIRTSASGTEFWRIPEIYIRGNTIKYLRIPDEIVDQVRVEQQQQAKQGYHKQNQRKGQGQNRDRDGKDNRDKRGHNKQGARPNQRNQQNRKTNK
jgi:U6 snRNA-associated Sm-like protein LSm4